MQSRKLLVGLVVLVFLALSGLSAARAVGPCAKDARKFCKGVLPGQGRIIRCLWHNRDRVSPACKEKAKRDWEKAMQIHSECAADARKFCKKVVPGGGRIALCLAKHEAQLQPACQAHVAKARKGVEDFFLGVCKKDREKFCAEVKAGGGRIIKCLADHMAQLKPLCRKKVKRHHK